MSSSRMIIITKEKTYNRFLVKPTFSFLAIALFMMIYNSTATTLVYASSGNSGSGSSTPSGSGSSSNPRASTSNGDSGSGSSTASSGGNSGSPGSSSSGSIGGGSSVHCDRPGYPSCSSLGSQAAKNAAPGSSCPLGHSKSFCNAYTASASNSANNNNNNNQPNSSRQQGNTAHCDRSGYPSCYSVGRADEQNHPGTSCPNDHSSTYCAGWNAGAGNTVHCDQPGWPSCYSLGYNTGKSGPGTSCPPGHSQAFCNGYEYASGGSGSGYIQGVTDPTHCDKPGFPACYDVGNHDGYNNAVNEHHQFHGYSQGVNNANHDWNSSNQNIHAFTYDCPSGHTKDFCNGYTDGYSDQVNDMLG